jgi:hypothetical protein
MKAAMKARLPAGGFGFAVILSLALGAAAAQKTRVAVFQPWASSGVAAGFRVVHTTSGACWEHSLSTDRPDAWRCMAGNDILDPCFSGAPHGDTVACSDDPFSNRLVLMKLTKHLDNRRNPTAEMLQPKGEPWAVRLTDGDACFFATGATDVAGGMRMNYECKGNTWLAGDANRSAALWTIRSITWPNKTKLIAVGIAEAVF